MAKAQYVLIPAGTAANAVFTVPVDYWQTPFGVSASLEFASTVTAGTIQLAYTLDELNNQFASNGQPLNPNLVGWTPVWANVGAAIAAPDGAVAAAVVMTFSPEGAQQSASAAPPFTVPFPGPIRAIRATVTVATVGGNILLAVLQGISPFGG